MVEPKDATQVNVLFSALNSLELYPNSMYLVLDSEQWEILVISPLADVVSIDWWHERMVVLLSILGSTINPSNVRLVSNSIPANIVSGYILDCRESIQIINYEIDKQPPLYRLRKVFNDNLLRLFTRYYDLFKPNTRVQMLPHSLVTALPRK